MKAVDDEVQRIKQHKETRREYMTYAMELRRQKQAGYKEGLEVGEKRNKSEKLEAALEMLRDGMPIERIAKYTKLSAEYIMELGRQQNLL